MSINPPNDTAAQASVKTARESNHQRILRESRAREARENSPTVLAEKARIERLRNTHALLESMCRWPLPAAQVMMDAARLAGVSLASAPVLAALAQRADLLVVLKDWGVDVLNRIPAEHRYRDEATPLEIAMRAGDRDSALYLLSLGADPLTRLPRDDSPRMAPAPVPHVAHMRHISVASTGASMATVIVPEETEADWLPARDSTAEMTQAPLAGTTPLDLALAAGHIDFAAEILAEGQKARPSSAAGLQHAAATLAMGLLPRGSFQSSSNENARLLPTEAARVQQSIAFAERFLPSVNIAMAIGEQLGLRRAGEWSLAWARHATQGATTPPAFDKMLQSHPSLRRSAALALAEVSAIREPHHAPFVAALLPGLDIVAAERRDTDGIGALAQLLLHAESLKSPLKMAHALLAWGASVSEPTGRLPNASPWMDPWLLSALHGVLSIFGAQTLGDNAWGFGFSDEILRARFKAAPPLALDAHGPEADFSGQKPKRANGDSKDNSKGGSFAAGSLLPLAPFVEPVSLLAASLALAHEAASWITPLVGGEKGLPGTPSSGRQAAVSADSPSLALLGVAVRRLAELTPAGVLGTAWSNLGKEPFLEPWLDKHPSTLRLRIEGVSDQDLSAAREIREEEKARLDKILHEALSTGSLLAKLDHISMWADIALTGARRGENPFPQSATPPGPTGLPNDRAAPSGRRIRSL